MNPIDPTELSAYLDGELDPARAREVEAALASSPPLQADFEALVNADKSWRKAAQGASFRPSIRLRADAAPGRTALRVAGGVALLLAARLVPKLVGAFGVELILNAIALTLGLIWIVRMAGSNVLPNA